MILDRSRGARCRIAFAALQIIAQELRENQGIVDIPRDILLVIDLSDQAGSMLSMSFEDYFRWSIFRIECGRLVEKY